METQALKQESAEWVRSPESTSNGSSVSDVKSSSEVDSLSVLTKKKASVTQPDRVTLSQQAQSLQAESVKSDALLTPNDQEFLTRLQARDNEVKMHEAAHLAAAGQYATSGASYTYQEGPNGKQYAIGGEVGIDVSPVADDPEATITKADTIVQAALSPASPSPQDFKVADQARQMRMQAVRELAIEEAQNQQVGDEDQKTQTQQHEAQKVESKKEALKQTESQQADVKAEIDRLQNNQQTDQQVSDTTTASTTDTAQTTSLLNAAGQPMTQSEQDQQAKEQEDKRAKEEADRLASLNQLFARYDEARKTYQAIVDFFTSQYEQSQKGQNRIELFA